MACVTLKRPVEVLGTPHHIEQQPSPKRRCGMSLIPSTPPSRSAFKKRKRSIDCDSSYNRASSSNTSSSGSISHFVTSSPSVSNIEAEIKRLQSTQGRKLFNESVGGVATTPTNSGKDQPLFTMKQVTMICQRMLKEREGQLREEYDKILSSKLLEQYDAFVKFSHDQVERRFAESAFSYVS